MPSWKFVIVRTESTKMHRVSKVLLCYPIIYNVLSLPTAIPRLGQFAGQTWGITAAYTAAALGLLLPLANVILYTSTRKGIINWSWLCSKRKSKSSNRGGNLSSGSYGAVSDTIHLVQPSKVVTKVSAASMPSLVDLSTTASRKPGPEMIGFEFNDPMR